MLADPRELRQPRLPHDRTGKIRGKQLSRRAEREDVGLVTPRKEVTADRIGDPLGAVVALKPVVDECSARSQGRSRTYGPPGSRVVLPNGLLT